MTLIPVAITEAADGDLSEYTNLLKAMYFFDYFVCDNYYYSPTFLF